MAVPRRPTISFAQRGHDVELPEMEEDGASGNGFKGAEGARP